MRKSDTIRAARRAKMAEKKKRRRTHPAAGDRGVMVDSAGQAEQGQYMTFEEYMSSKKTIEGEVIRLYVEAERSWFAVDVGRDRLGFLRKEFERFSAEIRAEDFVESIREDMRPGETMEDVIRDLPLTTLYGNVVSGGWKRVPAEMMAALALHFAEWTMTDVQLSPDQVVGVRLTMHLEGNDIVCESSLVVPERAVHVTVYGHEGCHRLVAINRLSRKVH